MRRRVFRAERPIVEALADLTTRIHSDFKFDSRATTVDTPLADVLRLRRGVCQDFAHLATGCLRSMGLAARYTSGYLRTTPPPGKARLVGADASHAWSLVLVRTARLGRLRSHQRLLRQRFACYDRVGPRLRRRLPDPRRLRRRRRPSDRRQRRRRAGSGRVGRWQSPEFSAGRHAFCFLQSHQLTRYLRLSWHANVSLHMRKSHFLRQHLLPGLPTRNWLVRSVLQDDVVGANR